MKKAYETPIYDIEKFTAKPSIFTISESTTDGWGGGGDEGEF